MPSPPLSWKQSSANALYLCRNGDLYLDTCLNIDDDLLDDLGGSVKTEILVSMLLHAAQEPSLATYSINRL